MVSPFDDDRLREPLLVFDEGLVEIDDVVETAGARAAGAVKQMAISVRCVRD